MSQNKFFKWVGFAGLVLLAVLVAQSVASAAADRQVKSKVAPAYPELAKKMAVSGTVRLEVTIAPAGTIKSVKVLGGHPLLVDSAVDAVKRWKYETGPEESTQVVEFKFSPSE